MLPFDPRKELLQLIINILADILMLVILMLPLSVNESRIDTVYMIMCLSLLALAFICFVLELVMDLYTFIPYDLYGIGLTVVIEDK